MSLPSKLSMLLLTIAACAGPRPDADGTSRDIVGDPFPEAQEEVRAVILGLDGIVARGDWDALRSAHVDSPKFSDLGGSLEHTGFEQAIGKEIAFCDASRPVVDWRDLQIDVFGDVAVATSFPVFSMTLENGEAFEFQVLATLVFVKTDEGWKIAHEHTPLPDAGEG